MDTNTSQCSYTATVAQLYESHALRIRLPLPHLGYTKNTFCNKSIHLQHSFVQDFGHGIIHYLVHIFHWRLSQSYICIPDIASTYLHLAEKKC